MSDHLRRLVSIAHDRTDHLPHNLPLRDTYQRAARRAEQQIPGDLGTAIAGILEMEAERLRIAHWDSPLGQSKGMLSLALSVLELSPEDPQMRVLRAEIAVSEAIRNSRSTRPPERP